MWINEKAERPAERQMPARSASVWHVVDSHTGLTVKVCNRATVARRMRDRRDMAYGAARYVVREVAL